MLNIISNERDDNKSQINYEFLFCLILFDSVTNKLKILNDFLQKKDAQISSALALVKSTLENIHDIRDNFDKIIENVAHENNKKNEFYTGYYYRIKRR